MKLCILHVGMHKTGTSSIQVSMQRGLDDPRFYYVDWDGDANGSRAMITLFGDVPAENHAFTNTGWSERQVVRYKKQLLRFLERSLARVPLGVCPVISAEVCWGMNRRELERVRTFMADRGYSVQIVVYLRPWKQWLESFFQQRLQLGQTTFRIFPNDVSRVDYPACIETLESVFGSEQVRVFKYDPSTFPAGCVVRHFCEQLGIRFDPRRIHRANDGLKLPAMQLLYAYRKLGPERRKSVLEFKANQSFMQKLKQLGGPPFRIHSSLIESFILEMARQRAWLEQRGMSFAEDIYADDDGICIREEADLFTFSPAALNWLAAATRSAPVAPAGGSQTAAAVADQMHRLSRLAVRKARFLRPWNYAKSKLFGLRRLGSGHPSF